MFTTIVRSFCCLALCSVYKASLCVLEPAPIWYSIYIVVSVLVQIVPNRITEGKTYRFPSGTGL